MGPAPVVGLHRALVTRRTGAARPPVAVVTGASRGIGLHVAKALEGEGWVVERGGSALADVSDGRAVQAWVEELLARHPRVDLLVNNAGVIDDEVDILASDPDAWWRVHEVNVRGAYLMTRFVVPHMLAAGGGRVVNLNSGSARRAGAVSSAYNASKAALSRVTGATHEAGWAGGVRAFDLMPGSVRTDMTSGRQAHAGRTDWTSPTAVCAMVLALASGELDVFSGRFVHAGYDTPESLLAMARRGLRPRERTLDLAVAPDDPLA